MQAGGYILPFLVVGGLCIFLAIPTFLMLIYSSRMLMCMQIHSDIKNLYGSHDQWIKLSGHSYVSKI